MKVKTYNSATAFRQALETRLNDMARDQSIDIQRLRRQVAFDRLLCRLFLKAGGPWILKGGYAMELRLEESRTTRDIDLTTRCPILGDGRLPERILRLLQGAVATDLNDFFVFSIGQPTKDLAGAPYGGARYPVEARMAGRTFARFHLDVASGDPVLEPVEQVRGRDWLAFANLDSMPFPAISKEQQFAEKLHAYTLPRGNRPNTRVRDLIDMFLLVRTGMDANRVSEAIRAVFDRRKTHSVPTIMPPPPEEWAIPFVSLAEECGVVLGMDEVFKTVERFVSEGKVLYHE